MVWVPSHDVIHTSVSLLSFAESVVVTVYATHFPSGESCGSFTFLTRYMSPTRMGRLATALCAPAIEANPIINTAAVGRKRMAVLLLQSGEDSKSGQRDALCLRFRASRRAAEPPSRRAAESGLAERRLHLVEKNLLKATSRAAGNSVGATPAHILTH